MAGVQRNFIVKRGLEVNNDLIYADSDSSHVGIGTTIADYTLEVNGGIGVTNAIVTGIATIAELITPDLTLSGTVSIGNTIGETGQYLIATGAGVTWGYLPTFRQSEVQTASPGQTSFAFVYTVGLLDVYVNGVKLSDLEYTATDGSSINLNQPCFGDETVEFISYTIPNIGYAFTGIYGVSILEEGYVVGTPGNIISINFVGAAITATGSGMGVTVYLSDDTLTNYWTQTSSGIHTLGSVGINTDDPTSALTIFGDGYFTGIVTALSFSGNASSASYSDIAGIATYAILSGISSYSDVAGIATYSTSAGIATYSTSSGIASYSDISGISTFSDYATLSGISSYADLAGISTYSDIAGIATYSEVSGLSTYSSLSGIASYSDVAGISTYSTSAGIASYSDVSGISTVSEGLTGTPNIEVGIVTASAFTSGIGVTDPVQIIVSGNVLTFNVVGVGSTSLILY